MYFDALKSGVVSKRLVNETTWNIKRRRKRTDNTKKRFWKTNLTVQTFNKAAKPRELTTPEKASFQQVNRLYTNKLTEQSFSKKVRLSEPKSRRTKEQINR